MAQLILKDSGLLVHEGLTAEQYEEYGDYSPDTYQITDTDQQWDSDWVPQRQIWFYVSSLDMFFQDNPRQHWLITAAQSQFNETQWDKIEEALEETGNFQHHLGKGNMKKVRKLVDKAEQKGLITKNEQDTLLTIFVEQE